MATFRFLFTTSFYPPYHLGGDAIHVKCLAEELARKGNEVHILHSIDAYRVKRNNYKFLKQEHDPKNIFVHRIESPLKRIDPLLAHTLGSSFYVQKKFSEVLEEVHPDVVTIIIFLFWDIQFWKNKFLTFPYILLTTIG